MKIYYKLYNSRNIEFFSNYFKLNRNVHRYDTSSANNVFLNIPNGNYGYSTFYYRASTMWNNLPSDIKQASSVNQFKRKLKKYLLVSQKERLNIV